MNVKSMKSKLTAAFSLIELMVVIAIVALLTAIAVPSYQGYLQQSKVTEIFSLSSDQMNQWQQQYNLGGTNFPVETAPVGGIGSYIASAELTDTAPVTANCDAVGGSLGTVCVVLNANAGTAIDPSLNGLVLRFSATTQGSSVGDTTNTNVGWTCGFSSASTSDEDTAKNLLSPGTCDPY